MRILNNCSIFCSIICLIALPTGHYLHVSVASCVRHRPLILYFILTSFMILLLLLLFCSKVALACVLTLWLV